MNWMEYALKKTGCSSRESFCEQVGIAADESGVLERWQALWSVLAGFTYHRLEPGQTLYQVALRYQTSIRAILMANEFLKGGPLQAGQTLVVPLDGVVVSGRIPMSSRVQELCLQGLRARYPILTGWSLARTAGGRTVWAFQIGSGRRKVLMTAGHHANEWITSLLLWQMVERYLDGIRDDGCIFGQPCRQLLEETSLYLVPMVNPDGVDLVTGETAPGSAAYERAEQLARTMPEVPFPEGWKANGIGVDLNLNYPCRWDRAAARKAQTPGPRDYPGGAPLDQPETRALLLLTRKLRPDAVAAWHTQGGELYGQRPDGTYPDEALARRLSTASGYALAAVPPESADAGFRDWVLQELDVPAFTIEAGRGKNPLPLSGLERLYGENLPLFALLLRG